LIWKGDSWSPRFSPGGNAIAFFENAGTRAVSIIDASGQNHRVLSDGWASLSGAPGWRPDGKEIWFTGSKEAGQPEAIFGVTLEGKVRLVVRVPGVLELDDVSRDGRVLAAHHTMVQTLMGRSLPEERERNLSWLDASDPEDLSPDGMTVVLTETGEGSSARPTVYLRRMDGSPAIKLGEGQGMALSPDGKWVLAETGSTGQPHRLVLLPTGTGQTRPLPRGQFSDYGAGAWFPDGKRIVFAAGSAGGPRRIYLQDVEAGNPTPLGPEGLGLRRGMRPLSPDGRWVFALERPGKAVIIPTDGGPARPLAGLEGRELPLGWSADGRSVFVLNLAARAHGAGTKIWSVDAMSGQRRLALEVPSYESRTLVSRFLLTPDAKTYVYSSVKGYSQLYLIEGLR
jgi:Tol biopolymer transport system component